MVETSFKKDETPYLVFACKNCRQYLYVKTTQKGKKCLRCGRNHTVSTFIKNGQIVIGMTAAVEMVKKKQDVFGKKELGHSPQFRAFGDFTVVNKNLREISWDSDETSEETTKKYKDMLKKLYSAYKIFPLYIIEIMAEDYGIPVSQLKRLTKRFLKNGVIVQIDDNSYTLKI